MRGMTFPEIRFGGLDILFNSPKKEQIMEKDTMLFSTAWFVRQANHGGGTAKLEVVVVEAGTQILYGQLHKL